jgi:putative PIN family toxin of toxin-antitoxin system
VIRAVLDANIFISTMIAPGSVPTRILRAAYALVFLYLTSVALANEVRRALSRDRIRRNYHLDTTEVARLYGFLTSDHVLVPITAEVRGVATHPEDDLILATAVSAEADYLVTGDRQLLALADYEGVQIISPREFLTILELQGSP